MKFIKNIFKWLFLIVVIFCLYAFISGKTYLFKAVVYNYANIDDYTIFENHPVEIGTPQPWSMASNNLQMAYPDSLHELMEKLDAVGLLMIKNDSIVFEKYWKGYSDSSITNSFSIAKSLVSLLIGVAIKEGKIQSVNQPVGDFIPEFTIGAKKQVKIIDLLTMSSGTNWNESYRNPTSVTTELYYGKDVYKTATSVEMIQDPGTMHRYKSGDTQLLGLILEKATKTSLSDYASKKLWVPMGAEHPALWSLDKKEGIEKAYCCFNSNARDFARIGKLMLDSGKWNGQAIIDSNYYVQSIKANGIMDEKGLMCDYYGYQWWIDPEHPEIFYARGILGQYVIIIPSKKIIIVRLGEKTSPVRVHTVPKEVRYLINWGLNS